MEYYEFREGLIDRFNILFEKIIKEKKLVENNTQFAREVLNIRHVQPISKYKTGERTMPANQVIFGLYSSVKLNPYWYLTGEGQMFWEEDETPASPKELITLISAAMESNKHLKKMGKKTINELNKLEENILWEKKEELVQ